MFPPNNRIRPLAQAESEHKQNGSWKDEWQDVKLRRADRGKKVGAGFNVAIAISPPRRRDVLHDYKDLHVSHHQS
jgi:hypothetical protein